MFWNIKLSISTEANFSAKAFIGESNPWILRSFGSQRIFELLVLVS